jgi:hypothetical protein
VLAGVRRKPRAGSEEVEGGKNDVLRIVEMTQTIINSGDSYGLNPSASKDRVLVQFNDHVDGEQVRLSLTNEEAIHLAKRILQIAHDQICHE